MKWTIILFGLLVLTGCFPGISESVYPEERYCMSHITELDCDQLLECYDWCDEYSSTTHANECREGYKARIWKCFGAIQE